MIGFRLVDPRSACWALVHRSAKRPGAWQVTFGDQHGPSGDTCRETPHDCLEVALADGLVLAEVNGGPEAEAIAAAVNDYRAAWLVWVEADDWTAEPPGPRPWRESSTARRG